MKNQTFCYWLQGYFEIASEPVLEKRQVLAIQQQLLTIFEPLGSFTDWLKRVCIYIEEKQYKKETLDYFLPIIKSNLNGIFQHVIDISYESDKSLAERQAIHDGKVL